MTNAPATIDDYRRDLERALKIIDERRPEYIKGRDYYEGTRAEVSASPTIRALIARNAEAAPISLAHIPVDVIIDKVELASLTAKEPRPKSLLETAFDNNDLDDEVDDWLHKAGYFGDYYAIVDPTEDDDEGTVTVDGLRVVGSSPLTTVVVYDRKDGRTALYGAKRWKGDGQRWHALLYYDDVTVKLTAEIGGDNTPRAVDYSPDYPDDGEPGDERIEHPGGRMLIEHLAIDGKPYGTPLHKRAWGPQDAITKVSATNLNNVDGQGFASRWALADPLAEIDDDIDDDFGTDGPTTEAGKKDGQDKATTGTSRVRSIPGAIALLRGIKQVGQFDATSSDDFLKNLDWYVRVMALACGVALFEFDLNGVQPSGESRRRAEGRSNRKARKVQRAAGAFLKGLGDTILAVLGTEGTVAATFNPLETSTDKDGLELVALKIKAGVPVTQALLEAGYTDEQVAAWYPAGRPHVTPDLLTVLASALAALGNARTLGVITERELADMLPTILTGARGEGPEPEVEPLTDEQQPIEGVVVDPSQQLKAKADALGALIRSGADPEQAAEMVGLGGLEFPNVPVTVRIPENEATGLEGAAPAAPAAPPAPEPPTPPADEPPAPPAAE